jgi:hypothetical protein
MKRYRAWRCPAIGLDAGDSGAETDHVTLADAPRSYDISINANAWEGRIVNPRSCG